MKPAWLGLFAVSIENNFRRQLARCDGVKSLRARSPDNRCLAYMSATGVLDVYIEGGKISPQPSSEHMVDGEVFVSTMCFRTLVYMVMHAWV